MAGETRLKVRAREEEGLFGLGRVISARTSRTLKFKDCCANDSGFSWRIQTPARVFIKATMRHFHF